MLQGPLTTGGRYRITQYHIIILDDTGAVVRRTEAIEWGDVKHTKNVLTVTLRDGTSFVLNFQNGIEASKARDQIALGVRHARRTYR